MDVVELELPGVKLVTPRRHSDERGFFSESYNERQFKAISIDAHFVQDNHSMSEKAGTVRGLHYQSPPFAQAKLVRVLKGSIVDVVVDVRKGSPAFGRHVQVQLDADTGTHLWVPRGFLHGFITLEANTEVGYKVDAYYSRECDGSVRWNDPELRIDWGPMAQNAVLSKKDQDAPLFSDFDSPFEFNKTA